MSLKLSSCSSLVMLAALALLLETQQAGAAAIATDNGAGSVELPAGSFAGHMNIVSGLPPSSAIEIDAVLVWAGGTEGPGGAMSGDLQAWNPTVLQMTMTGTGLLAGFARSLVSVPLPNVETHSALRVPFTPVQSFPTDLYRLNGQIMDPDFDLLRIQAGISLVGMPSPGQTTLTSLGGGLWSVDSFFDITYRIDFIGKPFGPLGGMSGSTNATSRFTIVPEVGTTWLLALGVAVLVASRRPGSTEPEQLGSHHS